jgi:hypothetical protein
MTATGVRVPRQSLTCDMVDNIVVDYFHHMYAIGKGKAEAASTLYGLNLQSPGIVAGLPKARLALKGYQRLLPSVQYPPLTWQATVCIAVEMVRRGRYGEAVATLVMFDSFLRIRELLGLHREDVALGSDPRIAAGGDTRLHLRLRKTKTGDEQGVEVLDDEVKALLLYMRNRTQPGHRIFAFSYGVYLRLFHQVTKHLGLSAEYVPHSLRHGGTTRAHLWGWSIADITLRGRWRSARTATHYIQCGRQALMAQSTPPFIAQAGDAFAHSIIRSFRFALGES